MRYSYSRLKCFDECQWKFYLRYVEKVGTYVPHMSTIMGKAVHDCLDYYYKEGHEVSLEHLLMRYRSLLTHELTDEVVTAMDNYAQLLTKQLGVCAEGLKEGMAVTRTKLWREQYEPQIREEFDAKDTHVRALLDRRANTRKIAYHKSPLVYYMDGIKGLTKWYEKVSQETGELGVETEVELKFELESELSTGPIEFVGYIDRLEELEDGTYAVVDYKTGVTKYTEKEIVDNMQLPLYAYAVEKLTDKKVSKLAIWSLSRDERVEVAYDPSFMEKLRKVLLEAQIKMGNIEYTKDRGLEPSQVVPFSVPGPQEAKRLCSICEFKDECSRTYL